MQALRQCLAGIEAPLPIIHPWPGGARFALVLTHDVESGEGLSQALRLAELERELGFRSSFNLVPYLYPIDEGIVRELEAAAASRSASTATTTTAGCTLPKGFFAAARGPSTKPCASTALVGFRSPMVHRNLKWLQGLEIDYDCSCFDVDPLQAMPPAAWADCGRSWPAGSSSCPTRCRRTTAYGSSSASMTTGYWERKLQYVAAHQGMAPMLTHPDYMTPPARLELYRKFLEKLAETGGHWHALPREVAAWWRDREASAPRAAPGRRVARRGARREARRARRTLPG